MPSDADIIDLRKRVVANSQAAVSNSHPDGTERRRGSLTVNFRSGARETFDEAPGDRSSEILDEIHRDGFCGSLIIVADRGATLINLAEVECMTFAYDEQEDQA